MTQTGECDNSGSIFEAATYNDFYIYDVPFMFLNKMKFDIGFGEQTDLF